MEASEEMVDTKFPLDIVGILQSGEQMYIDWYWHVQSDKLSLLDQNWFTSRSGLSAVL